MGVTAVKCYIVVIQSCYKPQKAIFWNSVWNALPSPLVLTINTFMPLANKLLALVSWLIQMDFSWNVLQLKDLYFVLATI